MTPLAGPATAVGLAVAVLVAGRPGAPRLLWNTTASAAVGLWTLQDVRRLAVGDWLAVRPPATLARVLDARGALPNGALLLKQVAALPPSSVCRTGDGVRIDGRPRAVVLPVDRWARPLPQWRGCRALRRGEVFFLNPAPGSLDSRYFGPLTTTDVVAEAHPWLTRPEAPHD